MTILAKNILKPGQSFIQSVRVALSGIFIFFRDERNGKIELTIAVTALILAFLLKISRTEWMLVLFCIALVITSEMLNTAIEKNCDRISTDHHPAIKKIKDLSAGAVLIAAVTSLIIGCIIFLPRIWKILFP